MAYQNPTASGFRQILGTEDYDKKPTVLWAAVRDEKFRPVIRTLADVISLMHGEGLEPIGDLRGGARKSAYWGADKGLMTWIDGETKHEYFRIAVPASLWFYGTDQRNNERSFQIERFNGARIQLDGSLKLKNNERLRSVWFQTIALKFLLTDKENHIVELLRLYFSLSPSGNIYSLLAEKELTRLKPFCDFVASHWDREGPAPSRETIATTVEAVGVRQRWRE